MTELDLDRRKVLLSSGAALTIGLAGCLGDDDDDDDDEDETLEDHLEDANNYDGDFEDLTGEDEVTVIVSDDHGNSFDPAAIEIDPGTTVVWEWEDSGHSATHEPLGDEDQLWDSEVLNAGDEYDYTFDDAGDYAYVCTPHRAQDHLGGVRVVDE